MKTALILSAIICGFVTGGVAQADVMVKVRSVITVTPSNPDVENPSVVRTVYYVHGKMRRRDSIDRSGSIVMTQVTDCERNTGWLIDPVSREYRSFKPPHVWSDQELREYLAEHPKETVRVESRTIDTGEKKTFFGIEARRLITTNERAGSAGKETLDGWYVDRKSVGEMCRIAEKPLPTHYLVETTLATYPEVADVHHTGPMPSGLAMSLTFTSTAAQGQIVKSERVVEEYSEAPLKDSFFELPTGLRENPKLLK